MILRKSNLQQGFTIIELMVVMGIIAILMPLGINAFINTRRSREVSEAAANARDAVKSARAMALSVTDPNPEKGWPVAYEVVFEGSKIVTNVHYVTDQSEHYSNWEDVKTNTVIVETSSLDLVSVGISTGTCDRVVFSSVNGAMKTYNGSGYSSAVSGDCIIEFGLENKERNLILNSSENKFEIVGASAGSVTETEAEPSASGEQDTDIYMPVE